MDVAAGSAIKSLLLKRRLKKDSARWMLGGSGGENDRVTVPRFLSQGTATQSVDDGVVWVQNDRKPWEDGWDAWADQCMS